MYEYLNRNYDDFTQHADVEIDLAVSLLVNVLRHLAEPEELLQDIMASVRENVDIEGGLK